MRKVSIARLPKNVKPARKPIYGIKSLAPQSWGKEKKRRDGREGGGTIGIGSISGGSLLDEMGG